MCIAQGMKSYVVKLLQDNLPAGCRFSNPGVSSKLLLSKFTIIFKSIA